MQHEYDWNDLKFFLALHRSKRMVLAGQALGIDQTTVARRVRQLEKSIGAQLFTKTNDGYEISSAGMRVLPLALEVERAAARAREQIGGEAGRLSGVVRVGAPDGLGIHFVAPVLTRFQEQYPDVKIELLVRSRTFRLSQQEAHLTFSMALPTSGRLLARRMTEYELGFYASRGYLEAHGRPTKLEELKSSLSSDSGSIDTSKREATTTSPTTSPTTSSNSAQPISSSHSRQSSLASSTASSDINR